MPSMGLSNPPFYALALEPMQVRNERIVMLFEAYAIFGALFMGGVWILYEYGSPYGYGGGGEDGNPVVHRIFAFVMAVALGINALLALSGALLWIVSITYSSSHQDFVFESLRAVNYLHHLLLATVKLFIVGLLLGIYSNLSPHWPETIVALVIVMAIYLRGVEIVFRLGLRTTPLEFYHVRGWLSGLCCLKLLFRADGEKLKAGAQLRAQELRRRAFRERKMIDPNFVASGDSISSVGRLLHAAAINLDMIESDVSIFEARLKEDWFNEADQLTNRSVECLSCYMPLRLAEEVHKLLETEYSETSVQIKSNYGSF